MYFVSYQYSLIHFIVETALILFQRFSRQCERREREGVLGAESNAPTSGGADHRTKFCETLVM